MLLKNFVFPFLIGLAIGEGFKAIGKKIIDKHLPETE